MKKEIMKQMRMSGMMMRMKRMFVMLTRGSSLSTKLPPAET